MKFFIPDLEDQEKAPQVWQIVKEFNEKGLGWSISDSKIYSVEYIHKGQRLTARVGEMLYEEKIYVIFRSNTYLICTFNRGFKYGTPILVGKSEFIAATTFD